jgi:hypothetical protein
MVAQMRDKIAQMSVEEAKTLLAQVEQQTEEASPDKRKLLEALESLLRQRIDRGDVK